MPSPKASGRRIRRTKLFYDMDLLREVLIRVDLIVEDGVNNIPTPITPLLEARLIDDRNAKAIPKRNFTPRSTTCIFFVETTQIDRDVYIPYRPDNANLKAHIAELISYPNVACVEYKGEIHPSSLQEFL